MIEYDDLHREDRYLWNDIPCQYWSDSSWISDGSGRKSNVKINIVFDGVTESEQISFYPADFKIVYDHRIKLRDLVDARHESGMTLRGTVVEIKPEEKQPYRVQHAAGGSIWMAAHEFVRYIRADAPEKAYASLMAVQVRITILETELTALRLTEEVLEGVYGL